MKSGKFEVGASSMRALATLLVANSLLLVPLWIANGGVRPHFLAIEAVLLVGAFLALPRRPWSSVAAWVVSGFVVCLGVLWLGEAAARLSLARSLNLYLDLRLLSSVGSLLSGALGTFRGTLVMVVGVSIFAGSLLGLALLLQSLRTDRASRARWVGVALVVVSLALVPGRWLHPAGVAFGLTSVDLVRAQAVQLRLMLGERERFAAELAVAPTSYRSQAGLFTALEGRDVIMAFVESYGMSALADPRYGPVVRPRLAAMDSTLSGAGLFVATGRLQAPSQGGQSWLGHGSVLSGLWLENQLRYDLLLASQRGTLVDDFRAAGYRTTAIMPAITLAWPEGERFGYDEIYDRDRIDYAGPPLNWVTMPDQFTWSFLERVVRSSPDRRPLFAQLGLISSHAPWTPILPVLDDWDSIGNGSVFHAWDGAGEQPEVLWRDSDRVREHYAMAIAYAIDVMASYAARYVDEGTVLIAMGDHQPAPLITGDDDARSVPVHVIVSDEALLAPYLSWGFVPGTEPDTTGDEPPRMDAFRDWFVRAFSAQVVEGP